MLQKRGARAVYIPIQAEPSGCQPGAPASGYHPLNLKPTSVADATPRVSEEITDYVPALAARQQDYPWSSVALTLQSPPQRNAVGVP
jgi:hypothetical protein